MMILRKINLVEVAARQMQLDPHTFRLLVFIGGGRIGGLSRRHASHYHLVIVVDVPAEIARYRRKFKGLSNVIYYSLGEGHTAATLFATADPQLRGAIGKMAPLNAEDGMGSLPAVGYQAIVHAMQTPEHARLLQFIVEQAVISTHGAPGRVCARTCIGEGGGTGAAAPVLLSRSLIQALSILEIPIDWDYECVGSVTYTRIAVRAPLNTASAQWRILRDLIRRRPADCPQLVESVRFIEFRPHGRDYEARMQDVALDEQSTSANDLTTYLHMIKPNSAMDGCFGLATSWTLDRTNYLSASADIVPYVAPVLLEQVNAALRDAAAVPSRISEVVIRADKIALARESVESIVLQPGDVQVRLSQLRRPGTAQRINLLAVDSDGHEYDLSRVQADFQQTPTTLTECRDQLLILSSLTAALESEILGVQRTVMEQQEELSDYEHELRRLLPASWKRGAGWLNRRRRLSAKCRQAAEQYRATSDELLASEELIHALGNSYVRVKQEADFLSGKLKQIADILDHHSPRGQIRTEVSSPVVAMAIDDAFPELLHLADSSKPEQSRLIAQLVVAVTLDGLAKVLQVPTPRLELVAEAIAHGELQVQGPPHGAKVQRREGMQVVVLPPLPDDIRNELVELISGHNPDLLVVVGDSAAAGIAVVRYTVFSADSWRDLFPGRMWADLRRAYEHEHSILFFPDGTEGLAEDLGLN